MARTTVNECSFQATSLESDRLPLLQKGGLHDVSHLVQKLASEHFGISLTERSKYDLQIKENREVKLTINKKLYHLTRIDGEWTGTDASGDKQKLSKTITQILDRIEKAAGKAVPPLQPPKSSPVTEEGSAQISGKLQIPNKPTKAPLLNERNTLKEKISTLEKSSSSGSIGASGSTQTSENLVQQMEAKLNELATTQKLLADKEKQLTDLEKNNQNLETSAKKSSQENQQLRVSNQQLTHTLAEKEKHEKQFSEQLKQLQQELKKLQEQNAILQQTVAEKGDPSQQMVLLQEKNTQLSNENQEAKIKFQYNEKQSKAWEDQIKQLEAKIKHLTADNERFQKTLKLKETLSPQQLNAQLNQGIASDKLIKIADDGNCFFDAVSLGLARISVFSDKVPTISHSELRKKIVEKEKSLVNDELFKTALLGSIDDYVQKLTTEKQSLEGRRDLAQDQIDSSSDDGHIVNQLLVTNQENNETIKKIEQQIESLKGNTAYNAYFTMMSEDRSFGSTAEIYALAQLYPEVSFYIMQKEGKSDSYKLNQNANVYNEEKSVAVVLAFDPERKHYDLFIPQGAAPA